VHWDLLFPRSLGRVGIYKTGDAKATATAAGSALVRRTDKCLADTQAAEAFAQAASAPFECVLQIPWLTAPTSSLPPKRRHFQNVCELDIVFNFNKVYSILDEFVLAGEVQETSKKEILERIRELEKLE